MRAIERSAFGAGSARCTLPDLASTPNSWAILRDKSNSQLFQGVLGVPNSAHRSTLLRPSLFFWIIGWPCFAHPGIDRRPLGVPSGKGEEETGDQGGGYPVPLKGVHWDPVSPTFFFFLSLSFAAAACWSDRETACPVCFHVPAAAPRCRRVMVVTMYGCEEWRLALVHHQLLTRAYPDLSILVNIHVSTHTLTCKLDPPQNKNKLF